MIYFKYIFILIIAIFTSWSFDKSDARAENPSSNLPVSTANNRVLGGYKPVSLDTSAKHIIIMEANTGAVLFEKNADAQMGPSSMGKILIAYLVFDKIANNKLHWQDLCLVSEKAAKLPKDESKMYLRPNERASIADLTKGIAVVSANDASIAIAEHLSGSEAGFAAEMTRTAHDLGAYNTNIINPSGVPHPQHYSTAKDIAIICARLIKDFPEYYGLFSEKEFTHNGVTQSNLNPLLYANMGPDGPKVDGIKTGHAKANGYGLAASATQGDQRLILVINGLPTSKDRARESEMLLRYGFREFCTHCLFKTGQIVEHAKVWLGDDDMVPLIADRNIMVTISSNNTPNLKQRVVYRYAQAPIMAGDHIADLEVTVGKDTMAFPLFAGKDVKEAGILKQIYLILRYAILGKI